MELQNIIITVIGASIPILIFYFGYRIDRRRIKEKEEKLEKQKEIERKHSNRIQFELGVMFFGPQKGHYITEITILLQNQGLVRKEINELLLSIRGIKKEASRWLEFITCVEVA